MTDAMQHDAPSSAPDPAAQPDGKPTLGFCGLGLMGAPMVRRLMAAGYTVHVWNRSPGKAAALIDQGALECTTPAHMADTCDVILLCLTDQTAVESVVLGPDGIALGQRKGGILVDHSSISPEATRQLAERLYDASGRIWIDAPVSGGVTGVEQGKLSIMAGGPADAIDRVRPALSSYAANITRLGDTGAGQVAKLCNQVVVATTVNAIAEAVALGAQSGIDATALAQALRGGWADSTLLQIFVPRMTQGYDKVLGTPNTMLKDLNNVLTLARQQGVTLPVTQSLHGQFVAAGDQGLGEKDLSDIVQLTWPGRS